MPRGVRRPGVRIMRRRIEGTRRIGHGHYPATLLLGLLWWVALTGGR